ncbi:hypothetical protein ACW5R3_00630 [Bizionia sp. KMM 8389]
MKKIKTLLLLLFTISLNAQDVILTTSNEEISAKIEEVLIKTISYKKTSNLTGPLYHINKSEVSKITYANGEVETFQTVTSETKEEISIAETKAFLVEHIEKYCFEHNSHLRKGYKAVFEGDYLRLTIMNKKGTKAILSMLYDFENVYAYKRVDERKNDQAYLNIYVPFLKNEKKNKWEKIKLVMSVDGHDNAESILNAFKHYTKLLKGQNKKPGKKF